MKKMIYSAACLALVIIIMPGCKESDSSPEFIPEGYYSGSYSYLGDTVFDAINFSLNTFQEVASGGIADQKFPCLVEGTYSIQNDKVEFVVLEYPSQGSNCDSGMLLSGTYNISIIGETIEFWKGEDPNKQSYKFEKVSSSRKHSANSMWQGTCFADNDIMINNMNRTIAKQAPLPHIVCTIR